MSDKKTTGVFTRISGDEKRLAEWEMFNTNYSRAVSRITNQTKKNKLTGYLKRYNEIVQSDEFTRMISELAELEHNIIQNVCAVNPKITMGTLKQNRKGNVVEHLIARAPFPFKDKNRNEFRLYLGKMSELPYATVEDVCKDTNFMITIQKRVVSAMNDIISGKANTKTYMPDNIES